MTIRILVLVVGGLLIGWFIVPAGKVPGGDRTLIVSGIGLPAIGIAMLFLGRRLRARAKTKVD